MRGSDVPVQNNRLAQLQAELVETKSKIETVEASIKQAEAERAMASGDDRSALMQAIDELIAEGKSIEVRRGENPRMYYDNQLGTKKCEFTVRLPGKRYDVGFLRNEEGNLEAVFDSWNGDVESVLGAKKKVKGQDTKAQCIGGLLQKYSVNALTNAAVSSGMVVTGTSEDEQGNIILEIEE